MSTRRADGVASPPAIPSSPAPPRSLRPLLLLAVSATGGARRRRRASSSNRPRVNPGGVVLIRGEDLGARRGDAGQPRRACRPGSTWSPSPRTAQGHFTVGRDDPGGVPVGTYAIQAATASGHAIRASCTSTASPIIDQGRCTTRPGRGLPRSAGASGSPAAAPVVGSRRRRRHRSRSAGSPLDRSRTRRAPARSIWCRSSPSRWQSVGSASSSGARAGSAASPTRSADLP